MEADKFRTIEKILETAERKSFEENDFNKTEFILDSLYAENIYIDDEVRNMIK